MNPPFDDLFAMAPALAGRVVKVTPLGGGLTNSNYKVDTADSCYVLRIAGADTNFLGIDRPREVACSLAAAAAGIGPEVIACIPEHSALVTAFVAGALLDAQAIRQPETLRRLAATLRRCHDHPAPSALGAFCPFAVVRDYHALASDRRVSLPGDLSRALAILRRVEERTRFSDPLCLCHNDLLPANFIDDGVAIRIIDWEYGGLGDRFFDLGNLAVNCQLDGEQEQAFLCAYFGSCSAQQLERLRLMRLASDMREAMWGFVQAALSKLHEPEYYLAYGRRHLDRFLTGAAALGVNEQ